ncbi:MAG: NUDIX domain-containing protein [Myxococcales bacterium FL481]|nr:MAG: NUDIX domain-containing protein [Myxococcales bacterium FL481]
MSCRRSTATARTVRRQRHQAKLRSSTAHQLLGRRPWARARASEAAGCAATRYVAAMREDANDRPLDADLHLSERATVHQRKVVWTGSVGEFGIDDVTLPNGARTSLAVLAHPGAAAVVPFLDAHHVVLLRQFRHAAGGMLWEVPAGKLDGDEDPQRCAIRELEEETGYCAARIEALGPIHTTPGFTDELIHLFAAFDLKPGQVAREADEHIITEVVPLSAALEWIDRGRITDAKSICALLKADRHASRHGVTGPAQR